MKVTRTQFEVKRVIEFLRLGFGKLGNLPVAAEQL